MANNLARWFSVRFGWVLYAFWPGLIWTSDTGQVFGLVGDLFFPPRILRGEQALWTGTKAGYPHFLVYLACVTTSMTTSMPRLWFYLTGGAWPFFIGNVNISFAGVYLSLNLSCSRGCRYLVSIRRHMCWLPRSQCSPDKAKGLPYTGGTGGAIWKPGSHHLRETFTFRQRGPV